MRSFRIWRARKNASNPSVTRSRTTSITCPESFQYAEKGEAAEEAINNLDYAIDQIDEVIENAEQAKG